MLTRTRVAFIERCGVPLVARPRVSKVEKNEGVRPQSSEPPSSVYALPLKSVADELA